jgi:hypothetical protein
MNTPLRARINNSRPRNNDAEAIRARNGIYEHGRTLEQLVDLTAAQWGHVEVLLQTQNMVRYEMNNALDDLVAWLSECFLEIFYSEFMFELRLDDHGKIIVPNTRRHNARLVHEIARLYNLTARIVHKLQQQWTGSPDQTISGAQEPLDPIHWAATIASDNYALAQFAEFVAGLARGTLGPIDDDRYHHPERRTWTEIHLRTKRRIANLARDWANEDARLIAEYDRTQPKN